MLALLCARRARRRRRERPRRTRPTRRRERRMAVVGRRGRRRSPPDRASCSCSRAIAPAARWPRTEAQPLHASRSPAQQWWWEVALHATRCRPTGSRPPTRSTSRSAGRSMLELRSVDVIHSFWVPNLHGKKDLIPGQADRSGFRPTGRASTAASAPSSAATSTRRWALVVVAEPAESSRPGASASAGHAARRRATRMRARGPAGVHARALRDVPRDRAARRPAAAVGPDLTHVASRRTIAAGTLPQHAGNLAGWIVDPQRDQARREHAAEPARSRDELQALLATWRASVSATPPRDAARASRDTAACPTRELRALERTWARRAGALAAGSPRVDHKAIGRRYIVTAFVFFLLGGLDARR